VRKEDVSASCTYPGKPEPSPVTLNSDIRIDYVFQCNKLLERKRFVSFAEKKGGHLSITALRMTQWF